MRKKLAKIGVLSLLLGTLVFPSTIAIAAGGAEASWTTVASMSAKRSWHQTEVINGKIYAIGGSETAASKELEVYDPSTDIWTALASRSEVRIHCQTEIINGKIYVIGGSDRSSAEVYDPSTDTWTQLASMSTARD